MSCESWSIEYWVLEDLQIPKWQKSSISLPFRGCSKNICPFGTCFSALVDLITSAAATAAIRDQDYFRKTVEKVKDERTRLTGQLRKLGFGVPDSSANFILAECKNSKAVEVYEKLARRNIFIRYFAYPELKDKLRITIGTAEQNDTLLSALKEILQE